MTYTSHLSTTQINMIVIDRFDVGNNAINTLEAGHSKQVVDNRRHVVDDWCPMVDDWCL